MRVTGPDQGLGRWLNLDEERKSENILSREIVCSSSMVWAQAWQRTVSRDGLVSGRRGKKGKLGREVSGAFMTGPLQQRNQRLPDLRQRALR